MQLERTPGSIKGNTCYDGDRGGSRSEEGWGVEDRGDGSSSEEAWVEGRGDGGAARPLSAPLNPN
jgi:hypothetical protein